MNQFQLFDSVKLKEPLHLTEGGTAPPDTPGAIVEILEEGEAYLVELFGEWVKLEAQGRFVAAGPEDPQAFMETIGVELAYPQQLSLVNLAQTEEG